MSQTSPPTITGSPTAPQRSDRATFSGRVDAFVTWMAAAVPEIDAVAANVYGNAVDAYGNAVDAASSASTASIAAASAIATYGATQWVSGTTYALGAVVWSPITSQSYRRRVVGAGTTDPSEDQTNWAVIGASGLPFTIVTGTTQAAVAGNHYILTNVAATTVTLPATIVNGDKIQVTVSNGLTTNVVARNGKTIGGLSEDLTLDNVNATVYLVGLANDWKLTAITDDVNEAAVNSAIDAAASAASTAAVVSAATTQANNAAASASTATTQAGIATTQAAAATAAAVGAQAIVLNVSTLYPVVQPSLNLDFANSQSVDPRITFTRASTATRTNSKGLIEQVASGVPRIDFDPVTLECKGLLIEEARTNLLTYSEQFDNAAWGKGNASILINNQTAPDGTLTSDKLVENTNNSEHRVYQALPATVGQVYTFSIYLKAGERAWAEISLQDTNGSVYYRFIGLTNGVAGAGNITSTITAVGGGWHRVSVTITAAGTGTIYGMAWIGSANDVQTYTGDGTSGIYIWGAQLEAGAFPTTYQPSTETFTGRTSTATYYNSTGVLSTASSGVARMNYNPANLTVAPKLLLEAASTNLVTYSEQFDDSSWVKAANTSISANSVTAPDGTLTADTLTYASLVSGVINVAKNNTKAASSITYTGTCYVTKKSGLYLHLYVDSSSTSNASRVIYNLSDMSVFSTTNFGTFTGGVAVTAIAVGNNFYRVGITTTSGTETNIRFSVYISNSASTVTFTPTAGDLIYLWGAQLEASPYPTSYIPTTTAAVTRSADTSTSAATTRAADAAMITGSNFSSWYRSDEGTFVAQGDLLTVASYRSALWQVDDGTTANRIVQDFNPNTSRVFSVTASSLDGLITLGSVTANTFYTQAAAYKLNDYSASLNGSVCVTDTSALVPVVSQLRIGNDSSNLWFGHIKRLTYFPKRLTNAELQALSTQ